MDFISKGSVTFCGRTILNAGEVADPEILSAKIQRCLVDYKMISEKTKGKFCCEQTALFMQAQFLRRGEFYNPADLGNRLIGKLQSEKRLMPAANKKEPKAANKKEPKAGDK